MAIVIPGLGYKSKALIAHETTYGTAPSAAEGAFEITGATITPKLSVIEDPSLSATQVSRRFIGQGGQSFEAVIRFRVGFEGLLHLLRAFFPTYAHTVADTNAHDHTFKEGINPFSYTIDLVWGGAMSGNAMRLLGAFGTQIRITGQAGTGESAMLTGEATFVAKDMQSNATVMTGGTLPTAIGIPFYLLSRTATKFKDGSSNASDSIPLKSFEFNVSHPYDVERFLFGSVTAEAPVRNGFTDGTWMFEQEFADKNLFDAAKANSGVALAMLFQHPTIIGAVSAVRELEIKANEPTAAEYSSEVPGFGVITQRASYRLAYDVSDASLVVIRVRSTEAAMTY